METLQFKTNAKCSSCVEKISKEINGNPNIKSWNIDLTSVDRILTISSDLQPDEIVNIIKEVGFSAEILTSK